MFDYLFYNESRNKLLREYKKELEEIQLILYGDKLKGIKAKTLDQSLAVLYMKRRKDLMDLIKQI